MSDWSAEPATSQFWADFVTAIKAHDSANAKMDYTGDTNIPTGTIRWNRSTLQFEEWSGSVWAALGNLVRLNATNVFTVAQAVHAASSGWLNLAVGDASHPGFIEFYTADNTRRGYLGYSSGTKLLFGSDGAWSWEFQTTPTINGVAIPNVNQLLGLNALADPNVDRILFWDDSAGVLTWLQPSTGIVISGTTISVDQTTLGSASVVASTLAKRDSAGDLFARYLNVAAGFNENPGISQVMVGNGVDGYLRWSSLAWFISQGGFLTSTNTPAASLVHTSGNETVNGVKTFGSKPLMTGEGVFLNFAGSGQTSGRVTVSTADPSGTPGAGDIWIKYIP